MGLDLRMGSRDVRGTSDGGAKTRGPNQATGWERSVNALAGTCARPGASSSHADGPQNFRYRGLGAGPIHMKTPCSLTWCFVLLCGVAAAIARLSVGGRCVRVAGRCMSQVRVLPGTMTDFCLAGREAVKVVRRGGVCLRP